MVRLTIRATDESVPQVLVKLMEDRLAIGVSTQAHPSDMTLREMKDAFGNVLVT
jgi:AP-2 complex subunit alpha